MKKQTIQLNLQTFNLVIGFMVWVILSSLMPSIREDISLTASQVSLVTALPVILGSLLRIPIGFYTNRYGARLLFSISFFILLFPVYFISIANSFSDLVIGGLFLGVGGAVFSIGVTSLPKYYPKEKHGFINGIYGVGNIGTAVTSFGAPVMAAMLGWNKAVQMYLILLLLFIALTVFLGDKQESKEHVALSKQFRAVYKNATLWALSLFYFITFGAFVAFTVYLPNFLSTHFELSTVDAGMRTAGFIALATFLRPVGGWLADKFNPYIILMITFIGITASGIILSFSPTLALYTIGTLSVAVTAGIGNGTIFKLVPLHFPKQAGIVNGIVSAIGGLGGFFPPLILTAVEQITGQYSIGFMALSQFALVSFVIVVWMYYQDEKNIEKQIIENTAEAIMLTDKKRVIQRVNSAFSRITGYTTEEALGNTPVLLQSGKHDKSFYQEMWKSIDQHDFWEGEIWNKRKDGSFYLQWLTISAIKNNVGEVRYYVGIFNDLSTAKRKRNP
ncbi:nitrate/nitrite transporter [Niallia circulans]|jgi:MFS transporter, NNP family, nitrate/nitrite transporter|uniref:Nitrate/nitrite transporter n=1 Tax=Niallia circulans TaxID=1397 RepID=A0A0J1IP33_NIACI|nr:nitrate/nitrite transporter [Niallia circulans]KLV27678.1 nitrate/nitrite transporter [Niallia circulans]MED5101781.1 MFS transporter [Niallia circulans]PAD25875.1 nitrate/nitrite transporter [Niallia circulans]PAD88522.1 nitrate/nitrite transporter [Niallia circulans]